MLPALGDVPLGAITRGDVLALLQAVAEEHGRATARNVFVCLRALLQDAVRMGRLARNPAAGLGRRGPTLRRQKAERTVLTREQADTLDDVLRDVVLGLELRIMLNCGLRISEVYELRACDYDRGNRQLVVRRSKTDAGERRVDVPDRLVDALDRVQRDHPAFALCVRPSQSTLRRHLTQLCKRAGVPAVTPHELRHTRLTLLLLAGVPVEYVSKQAGHASVRVTLEEYSHVIQAADEQTRRGWANA